MADENPKTTEPAKEPTSEPATEPTSAHQLSASTTELLSSAKNVAVAAQAKVAGAAENLLEAAKKLDEKQGVGQYLNKAQNYLHQMQSSGESAEKDKPTGGG